MNINLCELLSCSKIALLMLTSILSINMLACDDDALSARQSAILSTEQNQYSFPPPNYESQSAELSVTLNNVGGGELLIVKVTIEEQDEVKEISLLDQGDWDTGLTVIEGQGSKVMRFSWSVIDAISDEALVTIESNVGIYQFTLNTPDIDPEISVSTSPSFIGDARGGRVSLDNVPAGGLGSISLRLQSVGAINLNLSELCLLGDDNQCLTTNKSGSFWLCSGQATELENCDDNLDISLILPGASKTLTLFYAPPETAIDTEVTRLSIKSNAGSVPSFLLSIQGGPCTRNEEQMECGGCGDGVTNGLEECDDGNLDDNDSCLNNCTLAVCGDAIVHFGAEACDDGNQDNTDQCTNLCQRPMCGDGYLQADEECDDAEETANCDNDCTFANCGDGILNETAGEACDDQGDSINCDFDCTLAECGDEYININAGEACDDGNGVAGDGCSADCQVEEGFSCTAAPSSCNTECGDNITAGLEACDDGNTETETCAYGQASCTVCNALCQEEAGSIRVCGDGVIDSTDGEACDDGNSIAGDGCSADCQVEEGFSCTDGQCNSICGDRLIRGSETCDDGNTETETCAYGEPSCEVCGESCQLTEGISTYCGDEALNGPEECDLGPDNGQGTCEYGVQPCQTCSNNCELESGTAIYCGDGIVQAEFEDCDGTFGCNSNCQLPCSPNCPLIEMVDLDPGVFTMGYRFGTTDVKPEVQVSINYPLQISKYEITVEQYTLCVESGFCTVSGSDTGCNGPDLPTHPQNCITRSQTQRFAEWVGADLPSEAEWEYAAKGTESRIFPWGNAQNTLCSLERANYADCNLAGTQAYDLFSSPTPNGIYSLAGNVAEWTLDIYQNSHNDALSDGRPYCAGTNCDAGNSWVTKGGSYQSTIFKITTYSRDSASTASPNIGARIVRR